MREIDGNDAAIGMQVGAMPQPAERPSWFMNTVDGTQRGDDMLTDIDPSGLLIEDAIVEISPTGEIDRTKSSG